MACDVVLAVNGESGVGERWRVFLLTASAYLLLAYCGLPTAYCLLLYYLEPLECEDEPCPPPPPPDDACPPPPPDDA